MLFSCIFFPHFHTGYSELQETACLSISIISRVGYLLKILKVVFFANLFSIQQNKPNLSNASAV